MWAAVTCPKCLESKPKKVVRDILRKPIKVGDIVKLYAEINNRNSRLIARGKVYSLVPLYSNPKEPMVWISGQSAHHPKAVEVDNG